MAFTLVLGGGCINFQRAIFITFACVQTCVGPSDTLTILVLSLVSPPLMSVRYAPLPNTQTDPLLNDEMEAAFEDEDEDDDDDQVESRPLNPATYSPPRTPTPGRYDFENFDYASFPPPGSPTCPSSSSLPSDIGNSNGFIPSPSDVRHASAPRPSWFRRSARVILPNSLISRLHLDYEPAHGIVGGGTDNDGVFANVTAKPSRPVLLRSGSSSVLPFSPHSCAHSSSPLPTYVGDDTYLVPEDSQKDAPPSYASAQLDAVPPYWETTVHAPSSPDDMIIDHLPTGSVFSFLWNLMVSISFQFVGFLLTYLLHTTHAARFGSRAGLGVTLIQYGFALRSTRLEDDSGATGWWGVGGGGPYGNDVQSDKPSNSKPSFGTKEEAEEYYRKLNITMVNGMPSGTIPGATMDDVNFANDATTDWLSFFLMTIGASCFSFAPKDRTHLFFQVGLSSSHRCLVFGASSVGSATSLHPSAKRPSLGATPRAAASLIPFQHSCTGWLVCPCVTWARYFARDLAFRDARTKTCTTASHMETL